MARVPGAKKRYEVPQWMFLQWELLCMKVGRSGRGIGSVIRINVCLYLIVILNDYDWLKF